ncbi:ABC transporter permease [soil metagenome]
MTQGRSRVLWIGLGIVTALAFLVAVGPALAPYDPRAVTGPSLSAPSGAHLLGTNDAGQDIASQLLVGARSSLTTGFAAAALAALIGLSVGATAGLVQGRVDVVTMRIVDLFLALPGVPLMILVAALVGPSRPTIVAVIALAGWPPIARVVRGQTLVLSNRGFIAAARGLGAARLYIVRRHLAPGMSPLIMATFVSWASAAIVLDAGLAFLGLGDPTAVSWGSVLQRALGHSALYTTSAWTWWVLPAGVAVTVAALGLALVGFALEPHSNPRWRRA